MEMRHYQGIKRGNKMKNAVSYLRVSGKSQIDGDGFPRQRDRISKWAKANKHQLVGEFCDEGISGTSELSDRPGLAALLDRIESNGVRIVLVENATRWARDLMIQEVILEQFRQLGVQVIEVEGGNDLTLDSTADPTATLIRQILGAVSEFEKNVIVLKLRAARERKRRAGERCEGRKPFGSSPSEQKTLDVMRKLARKPKGGSRLSFGAIADRLNQEGHSTRSGKPWKRGTVHAILSR
mgnify:FL=1|jgi:DNA invertase Pin-like site-specific DNA recombinase